MTTLAQYQEIIYNATQEQIEGLLRLWETKNLHFKIKFRHNKGGRIQLICPERMRHSWRMSQEAQAQWDAQEEHNNTRFKKACVGLWSNIRRLVCDSEMTWETLTKLVNGLRVNPFFRGKIEMRNG